MATAARKTADESVPLAKSLGYHIRELSEAWTKTLHSKTDAHGVTQGQWRYLRELWEQDGISQRELSERVGRQGPTTVSAMKSLARSGYVRIVKNKHDHRKTQVYLTKRGRDLKAVLVPVIREVEALALQDISAEELDTFVITMMRMKANLTSPNMTRFLRPSQTSIG